MAKLNMQPYSMDYDGENVPTGESRNMHPNHFLYTQSLWGLPYISLKKLSVDRIAVFP
jgi:hypothetical protein